MDNNRAEAERWLGVAERLLASRDLHGTRTFAIRVRDFNPILADQILAVADTLLAAQADPLDWYRILQLAPLTSSAELVANQYRKLAVLLNPASNHLLYADQAFRLVSDAWTVLSNPSKKVIYDNELRLGQLGQQQGFMTQLGLASPLDQMIHLGQQHPQHHQQPPQPPQSQPQQMYQHQQSQIDTMTSPVRGSERVIQFSQLLEPQMHQQMQNSTEMPARRSPRSKDGRATLEEERPIVNNRPESTPQSQPTRRNQSNHSESARPSAQNQTEATRPAESTPSTEPTRPKVPSFWTACPYCFILYEYPKIYEDCCLRCQKCRRAFHAATIPSPPLSGNDSYFCCWGFFPVGAANKRKYSGPWEYYDDDDIFVDLSDVSDDSDDGDWREEERRKKAKNVKSRVSAPKSANKPQSERVRNVINLDADGDGPLAPESVPVKEVSKKASGINTRRQMRNGAKDLGKLDLNVEFSNDVEEPNARRKGGNRAGVREEENIEGNGFFEGLDEFFNNLPILSVGDDKVKAA